MSKTMQRLRAPRPRKTLAAAPLAFCWLSGLAVAITVIFAGYLGMGAPALVALARLATRRIAPPEITTNRHVPWIILWLTLDAVTLLGATILACLGFGIIGVSVVVPPLVGNHPWHLHPHRWHPVTNAPPSAPSSTAPGGARGRVPRFSASTEVRCMDVCFSR